MRVFTNSQSAKKAKSVFSFEDFSELKFEQLVTINGGCGGYSPGGSYGSYGSCGGAGSGNSPTIITSSSTTGTSPVAMTGSCGSSASGSSSISITGSCGSSASGSSPIAMTGSCGSSTSSENSNANSNSTSVTSNVPSCSGVNFINITYTCGTTVSIRTQSNFASKTEESLYRMNLSIAQNMEKKYNFNESGYMCDNWVEEVLNDAGYDASKYLAAGKASEKTVQEHIDALCNKGSSAYTQTVPTKDGVYVVLMNNGHKNKDGKTLIPHAALLVIENGKNFMIDNSSGNKQSYLGFNVERTYGSTAYEAVHKFGYDSFYFQEVK